VPENQRPLIRLEDVRKVFYADEVETHALSGIHLDIARGEFVSIEGPSGCGKSTLLSILGLLEAPTEGRHFFAGRAVEALTLGERARLRNREIGFIFQAFNLIPELTVRENVEVPLFYQRVRPAERHRRAIEMLQHVGLGDRLDHRPNQLSGGQQQRCAIARALVTNPAVLMADEPTGNLDSSTGAAVLALFRELHNQGKTIIMVTHDPLIGSQCERIIRLRDGLIESDTLNARAEPALAGRR
jgi:putative ABC transport system ATP-binding protein